MADISKRPDLLEYLANMYVETSFRDAWLES